MPPNDPASPQPDYSFITNPGTPPQRHLLPGAGSLVGRVILVSVGLLVLVILLAIVKSLLSPPSNTNALIAVAQDQTEILHVVDNVVQQQYSMSTTNKNFDLTAHLTITSAQSNTLTYLKKNHKKVAAKQLNAKISSKVDSQLRDAASASTFDPIFHDTMKAQMTSYESDLKAAYSLTKGAKGKALLSNSFENADLLLKQLDSQ